MEGPAMRDLHERGATPEATVMMAETHSLAAVAALIMDFLATMPSAGGE